METELIAAARELFAERGYDEVTVDEVAAKAGVSTRTFYRYFAAKEDLVVVVAARLIEGAAREVASRLASESPIDAIYHALSIPDPTADAEFLVWAAICARTPALRLYQRGAMQTRARAVLSAVFAEHLGVDGPDDMRPDVIAGALIGAMDVATERWSLGGGDRNKLLTEALLILRTDLTAPLVNTARKPRRRRAQAGTARS